MAAKADGQGGSFRDPAGHIFSHEGQVYRQINMAGRADYDGLMSSGLYEALAGRKLLVAHTEVTVRSLAKDARRYKVIRPDTIPFISYPYEWTFGQLKQAALTTLEILKTALDHGMILKDASAYNIQFIGGRPVFIDTLSFTPYAAGDPWEGYKQFCEHFIAPLALSRYGGPGVLKMLRAYLDGIPLATAAALLPRRARLSGGLLAHVYLHNASQRKHQKGGAAAAAKASSRKVTPLAMQGLISSLEKTVRRLNLRYAQTEWGDYYTFTNYSDEAFQTKRALVAELLGEVKPKPVIVWDIGANNGEFSEVAAQAGAYTVAFDIDEVAVGRNVAAPRDPEIKARMLPLVQDLTNPSPALGWSHVERMSMTDRGPADVVMALALIHHLAIGNNVPLDRIASFLKGIGKYVIIEFVPKGDSKVDHLLASRKDIFDEYDQEHFEHAMAAYFKLVAKKAVKGSKRSIYLYKA